MRLRFFIALLLVPACTKTPRGESVSGAVGDDDAPDTADAATTTDGDDDDDDTQSPGTTSTTDATDTSGGSGLKLDVGAADTGTTMTEIAEVFGHSANTLYRLDPDTKAVTTIGMFEGCTNSIIDIALNADSEMYGTAFGSLWSIDRTTAACTFIADGSYPTSLSFVPAGTVDPDEEAMVGFVGSEYVRIDTQTGAVSHLGNLGGGLSSSGDMVSVKDGGSWLTVVGPGCNAGDCIIEIDPTDGTVIQNYGAMPYVDVFGLAFWAGRAYGFSNDGALFEVIFGDTTVATMVIEIPGAPGNLSFFGAGSTTSAPPAEG